MRKLIILFLCTGIVTAQEFSFTLNFEDALGNTDSLVIGYDNNGTDGIDPAFGEVNIISVPYNSGIDVRISDEWENRTLLSIAPTYHTKKQIYAKGCPSSFTIQTIDIVTDNWPVTATWDNNLFNDTCRAGSVFTSINPGGWWDTASPSNLYQARLLLINEATFTSNHEGSFNENYSYMNDDGDIIPVYWTTFGDESIVLNTENFEKTNFKMTPNPTSDSLKFSLNNSQNNISNIHLYDESGRKIKIELVDNSINVQHLKSGIYFVKLQFDNGQILVEKFIKE